MKIKQWSLILYQKQAKHHSSNSVTEIGKTPEFISITELGKTVKFNSVAELGKAVDFNLSDKLWIMTSDSPVT